MVEVRVLEGHDDDGRPPRLAAAHLRLSEAQPDYVTSSVAALIPVLTEIETRLARGERPRPSP
jgi:hypothetical protein